MAHNSTETDTDSRHETLMNEELTVEEHTHLFGTVSEYVQQNPGSTNTQLFSLLALLNAYIPESYLLIPECQKILGPPDPIHGGPPFEERMEPFTAFIKTCNPSPRHVGMTDTVLAQRAVARLADLGISRSATMTKFMDSLCGDEPQQYILNFIKDLLTKRAWGENGKDKFSRLIEDIEEQEGFYKAVSVLEMASKKWRQNHIFPQIISRLHYIRRNIHGYGKAEEWAKKAIERAPNSSYAADTLGQIYKNRLRREPEQVEDRAKKAFIAFKDVEMKADKEEGPDMKDTAVSFSNTFNNRGLFGFIQVAKIAFEKLRAASSGPHSSFIQNLKREVEDKFDFFEWYLTYSKSMPFIDPPYFWKDIVLCYKYYTTQTAAESTSFPGLLDCLNHGLFTSKGRHAGFEEAEETVSDLEAFRDDLKTTYEANVDDVKAAERYILSNIILSNKMHDSPQLTPVKELQLIMHRFLGTEVGHRSPEFYLLVLLLFWLEGQPQVVQEEDDEEVEQPSTDVDGSEDQTWEDDGSEDQTSEDEERDEEQETRGEPANLSLDLMFDPDLQQQVTFMEKVFETDYAKYLRGRCLLPLFFLGKGSGLSKWVHKSRLDRIVEEKVDAELDDNQGIRNRKKWRMINNMWIKGRVWQVQEIQDILLPVRVELCHSPMMPQEHEEQKVLVWAGGKKIMATTEVELDASVRSTMRFYLGFTIKGPVIFKA